MTFQKTHSIITYSINELKKSSSTSYDDEYPTMPSLCKPLAITGYKFVSVLFGVVFLGLSPPALMDLQMFLRYEIAHPEGKFS